MALQIGQGCWPSNVMAMASWREQDWRLFASIVVHATDCNSAQWALMVATSEKTTNTLPSRTSTMTS